jgi:hypothetical protein
LLGIQKLASDGVYAIFSVFPSGDKHLYRFLVPVISLRV